MPFLAGRGAELADLDGFDLLPGGGKPNAPADALRPPAAEFSGTAPAWGCSLFAFFSDPQAMLYGRNFDWEYSPALLLFT